MMRFRSFRNGDPPALADIWACCASASGAAPTPASFERAVFSKPYFDPAGLIVAEADGEPAGFVHAGFGPNADESNLDRTRGVICAVMVRPDCRRRGIGRELMQHADDYLSGAQIQAGAAPPLNPFYFGLYGGSDSPGFLDSDESAEPFFRACGYESVRQVRVLQLRLASPPTTQDARAEEIVREFEIQYLPNLPVGSWWQNCVLGWVEPMEFRLVNRTTSAPAARVVVWEMEGFATRERVFSIGILDLFVRADFRRRGLARFLVGQVVRIAQEQRFGMLEAQVHGENEPALDLFRRLGFDDADRGSVFIKHRAPGQ